MKIFIIIVVIFILTVNFLFGDSILLTISACPKTHWTMKYTVTYKDESKNILNELMEGEGTRRLLLGEGVINMKARLTGSDCASAVVKIKSSEGIHVIPVSVSPEGNFGLRFIEDGSAGYHSVDW